MSFFRSMDISASALTAQRFRMDVIAENLANSNTTRTASGEPYRRRYTVFQERSDLPTFSSVLNEYRNASVIRSGSDLSVFEGEAKMFSLEDRSAAYGSGVRVTDVLEDDSPFLLDYNPTHPDADEDGYVRLPNVDTVREMTDMMTATRSYEANITALNTFKSIAMKTLEIGK